ncbi:hypothetical protein CERSUDRAFT_93724 [Gelatoporia subvermispora B]|uniref:Protein kinase domain-containing protein n=1 Tax=Ceriporiopsis subvermispora (strain B) TaxID=914234 RepID=M2RH90_CERS8|nr:hypothetical protein CERSUDRAFT_93724 [Gelatoporia subvermispora B]
MAVRVKVQERRNRIQAGRRRMKEDPLYAIKAIEKEKTIIDETKCHLADHVISAKHNERRALVRLPWHPFITGILDAFTDPLNTYLLLELVPGKCLHGHVTKLQNLTLQDVRFYLANMTIAVEFLHEHKFVHRDIKPLNFIVGPDGYLQLCDLGTAARIDDEDEWKDTGHGTELYHSPEVAAHKNSPIPMEHKHRWDIDWWAVALSCIELATKTSALKPVDAPDGLVARRARDRPILWLRDNLDVIPSLGHLLNTMLQEDWNQRKGTTCVWHKGRFQNLYIRRHPFMRKIDWTQIEQRRYRAPHPTTPYPKMTEGWNHEEFVLPASIPGLSIAELPASRMHDDRFKRVISLPETCPQISVHSEGVAQHSTQRHIPRVMLHTAGGREDSR